MIRSNIIIITKMIIKNEIKTKSVLKHKDNHKKAIHNKKKCWLTSK